MRKWLALYNYGTMSFYWGRYEATENEPAFESRMNASAYLSKMPKLPETNDSKLSTI